jgi:cell wall-associated NlpC family hydrolase
MQGTKQLPEVWRFPVCPDAKDLRDVEKAIREKYLGTPYLHRGRDISGLDCWGFLKLAYADLGYNLFDIEDLNYERLWSASGRDYFKENYWNDWHKVEKPDVFDGVLFVNARGIANHAGIVLNGRKFIHCCRQGVVVAELDKPDWIMRTEGFYRLKDRKW